jgi:hypothetical protein
MTAPHLGYWLVPGGKIVFAPTALHHSDSDRVDARFERDDGGFPYTIAWALPLAEAMQAARDWRDARRDAARRRFGVIQGGRRDWSDEMKRWEF